MDASWTAMRIARHKRQILLFLIAILVPSAVLIALAQRMLHQDRELAAKRAFDQRRAAVDQLRRELAARLEAIKLQELNRLIRSAKADGAPSADNPAVLFTGRVEGDRMILPWEAPIQPGPPVSKGFAQHQAEGERQEFGRKDYGAATAAYRSALALAQHPWESCEARLLLARTLSKVGNSAEASSEYKMLLKDSTKIRDEQGVGYRFYAAERLVDAKREPELVLGFLNKEVNAENRLTPPELYMIRSMLRNFPVGQTGNLQQRLSSRIQQVEQAMALAKDFRGVRAQVESSVAPGPVWIPYGDEPWLVSIAPPAPPLPAVVVVISSGRAAPPTAKLLGRTAQGDTLGETFPGLHVQWLDNRLVETARQGLPAGLWVTVIALVLGIAVFGGYLLLRDVDRDLQMTEVRSQFVASVSHELKTPLTAIRMFAETLALGRGRDERTKSEYLETIVSESERLARLVDNVLDFSKIEQGKKMYRFRPIRLEEVAGSAVRAMQFPLAQQGFQLHLSVQEDMPELEADPDAMQQAILNLLTNAMKYSGDAREIDLRIAAREGDAVIEVADHGLGIASEEQKHVFEKFYRAPAHERRLIAGTGLGLTLVAHIAKAHGGRVDVESAPGCGSTFSIFIPIHSGNGVHS